jgi:hypothetical protein
MSSSIATVLATPCPHELRPGTAVCLHCRREAREAHKARVKVILLRVGAAVLALAACAAVATAVQRRPGTDRRSASSRPTGTPPRPAELSAAEPPAPAPAPAPAAVAAPTPAAPATRTPAYAATSPAVSSTLRPAVAEGRTELRDGMYAERHGDTVTVFFDTELGRTRRPEKFEQIVRATLPAVYGPAADSLLAHAPAGAVANAGELLADLPARGVHLSSPSGARLALWPTTRPGRDGPLVVTYRAVAGH